MEAKNLWGDLELDKPIRTPVTILKEQASVLSALTKGILHGDIEVHTAQVNQFYIKMYIVAPAIGDYYFNVLDVSHGIDLYPATVIQLDPRKETECQSEDELTAALGSILGSERIGRVIRSLVAQSKAV
jgi:hypothetical protein